MNSWKVSFFVTLVLLVASNVFWLYALLNSGISYTYQQVSLDEQLDVNKLLGELIVKGGQEYSQKDLLHLLRQSYPDAFIVEDGERIISNRVTFVFSDGKLSEVK